MEVRDYECDLQGIVNNAEYQHYLEHARHQFLRSVGHVVGAAEVPALDHPDLKVLPPADRAVGAVAHTDLLAEDAQSLLEGEVAHEAGLLAGPAVVHPGVVIVFDEVAGDVVVEVALEGQGVEPA